MKKINEFGYRMMRPIVLVFLTLLMKPKAYNKNRLIKKGGYILAGNHLSIYDGPLVGCISKRPIHFLAKKELFDNKFLGPIVRFIGLISVDRKNKNPEAKELALDTLKAERVVCVFPEGTCNRTNDKEILPFKYGAVSFALKSGKPILPFAIVNKPRLFYYNTKIIFGEPYYVKNEDLDKEIKILEKKVVDLIHEGKSKSKRKA